MCVCREGGGASFIDLHAAHTAVYVTIVSRYVCGGGGGGANTSIALCGCVVFRCDCLPHTLKESPAKVYTCCEGLVWSVVRQS